jgi:hypothetical protein
MNETSYSRFFISYNYVFVMNFNGETMMPKKVLLKYFESKLTIANVTYWNDDVTTTIIATVCFRDLAKLNLPMVVRF